MAKQRSRPTRRRDKKGGPGSGRRKPCQYCRDKIDQVDYKDVGALRKFISERGKIRSRRITGACRRHQSQIARAVKRARELALLPYVGEGGPRRARRPRRPRPRPRPLGPRCPQAILLQDVETLGERGTVVDVSKGYLRNYLIPRKLAAAGHQGRDRGRAPAPGRRPSGPRARRPSAPQENADAAQPDRAHDPAAGRRRRPPVRLGHRAGHRRRDPRGPRPRVDSRKVHLEEPISNVGTYMVVVEVADGVTATVKTMVVAQK